MRGSSFFRNQFNKFNNTGARMLDSIYHMPLKYLKILFWCENVKIFPYDFIPQATTSALTSSRKDVN